MNEGSTFLTPGAGAPYLYDYINENIAPIMPSTVHVSNTGLSRFFQKYLTERALSRFEWTMPKTWARNYFLYSLYLWGRVAIINTDRYGVIPQGCGLMGYDIFYQPRQAVITNPLLRGIREPVIGQECTVIKLQPNYSGIYDIVSFYADMMALTAESIGVNLLNSKLAYVFFAKNASLAESFKKAFDSIASGEACTVLDKAAKGGPGENEKNWEVFNQDLKKNYLVSDLLSDFRKIESMFDTAIGIPNSNTDKRERLIVDEVNSNNVEVYSTSALWLDELEKGCEETRELFGIDISVRWRNLEKEGISNESHNDGLGDF